VHWSQVVAVLTDWKVPKKEGLASPRVTSEPQDRPPAWSWPMPHLLRAQ
jgi:hypothetical protein